MGRQGTVRDNVVAVAAWPTHAPHGQLGQNDPLWLAEAIVQRYQLRSADGPCAQAVAERIYRQLLSLNMSAPAEPVGPFLTEVEEHEAHTIYLLLQERATGMYAGCARLVAHDPSHPDALLPLEARCIEGLRATQHRPWPRETFCEIDLLAIHPKVRFHPAKGLKVLGSVGHDEWLHPSFPGVELALYLALRTLQLQQGIAHALTILEPRLARILCSLGLGLQPLSKTFALYGTRAVYINTPPPYELQPLARALNDALIQQLQMQGNCAQDSALDPWMPEQSPASLRARNFSYRGEWQDNHPDPCAFQC